MLRKLKCSLNIFLNWFKFSESKSKEIPVNDIWKWIKIKCSFKSNLFDYQGLKTDNHFTFEEHTNYLCQTANYKLHALRRIRKCLLLDTLCFASINSPFYYHFTQKWKIYITKYLKLVTIMMHLIITFFPLRMYSKVWDHFFQLKSL